MRETRVLSLGQEDPLRKGMATHSGSLAWRIPWAEKPGRLWGHKESHTTDHTHTQKYSPYFKIVEDQNFLSSPNISHFLLFFTVSLKNLQYFLQKILITFFLPEMFLFHIHSLKIIYLEKKIWINKFEFLSALKVVSLFCIFHTSEHRSTAFKYL